MRTGGCARPGSRSPDIARYRRRPAGGRTRSRRRDTPCGEVPVDAPPASPDDAPPAARVGARDADARPEDRRPAAAPGPAPAAVPPPEPGDPRLFVNRELSLLQFQWRVFEE